MGIRATCVPKWLRVACAVSALATLSSCVTRTQLSQTAPGTYLDLYSSAAISTIHFPRGSYTLASTDSTGFYYRSPTGVIKHSFAGPQPYDGGVFVSRRQPPRLRGYIIWAAGLTKIGDLTRHPHAFRD